MAGPFVSRCVEYVEAYRPYYHPISILQRRTFTCLEAWCRHHRLSIADRGELGGPASADAPCDAEADESALRSLVSAVATHLETLYGHPPLFFSPDAGEAPRQLLLPDDPHFGAFGLTKRFATPHSTRVNVRLARVDRTPARTRARNCNTGRSAADTKKASRRSSRTSRGLFERSCLRCVPTSALPVTGGTIGSCVVCAVLCAGELARWCGSF